MAKQRTPQQQLEAIERTLHKGSLDPRHLNREAVYLTVIRYLQQHVTEDIRDRSNQFVGMC